MSALHPLRTSSGSTAGPTRRRSELYLFRQLEGVIDLDAEVADGMIFPRKSGRG